MPIEGWTCEHCQEFYDWESEAEQCCSYPDPAWKCDFCYEVFSSEEEASWCCPESILEADCSD